MPNRIGILTTHPVQYYAPWFRYLAERVSLKVFYAHEQTAKEQADAGFGVEFDWDTDLLTGYEYQWLRNVSPSGTRPRFLRYNTPEISDAVRDGAFSAFLIIGWDYLSAWQACRACLKNSVPVFMRGDSQLRNRRSALKLLLKRIAYPYALKKFSGHLYVGARNREYLARYGVPGDRLHFAPHFVDCEYFKSCADTAEASGQCASLRRLYRIPDDAFVFTFVGKLIDKKRPGDFLEGFEKYQRSGDAQNVHALIVGEGPLRGSLEQMAASLGERVHFTGFVNQSEIPAYYRLSDVVVLPSDARETWGLVVNEAAACGRPAIVSEEVGCSPDLIDNEYTGFTYELGDRDLLVNRMLAARKVCEESPERVREALAKNSDAYSIARASEGLMSAIDYSRGSR